MGGFEKKRIFLVCPISDRARPSGYENSKFHFFGVIGAQNGLISSTLTY